MMGEALKPEHEQTFENTRARFVSAQVAEDGRAIAILMVERDGSTSGLRIGLEQVLD
jgi:hypothetical protein